MKKLFLLAFISLLSVFALQAQVSGVVVDQNGEPMIGVSVAQPGTSVGTITDFDGRFTLNVTLGTELQFSYVGYKTETLKSSADMNVRMSEDTEVIEEVVVVGYGTQRKSDLTGSVASVKADDMNKIPTSSVAEMLRGQAAGVMVTQSSARPGGTSDIVIRGKKSLNGSSAPLYIVDGAPVENIDDLNAQDIQSVEILKDASSQSIYGARASNGVILVTTKSGKEGTTQVDLNAYAGAQTLKRNFDLYSGDEFVALKREVNRDLYSEAKTAEERDLVDQSVFGSMYDNLVNRNYTDWEKEMIKPAVQQKYDVSVRGGNAKNKIAASLGFFDQKGMISPAAYRRYNMSFNSQHELHKRVKLGVRLQYANAQQRVEDGSIDKVITRSPLLSARDKDGDLRKLLEDATYNPMWNNENYLEESKSNRFRTNLNLDWNIWGGLSYRLNANLNYSNKETGIYLSREHEKGSSVSGSASIENYKYEDYLLENIFNYEQTFKQIHKFDATFVQSINYIQSTSTTATASGFSTDDLAYDNISAASVTNPTLRDISPRRLVSFMLRARYNLMDKYLFSLSARVDGSSVFGKNNKWGVFPAGSFAWRVNQENWLKDVQWLTNLKLRASYGETGNQAIRPYQTQGLVDSYYYKFGGNTAMVGYLPSSQLSNPDLKWETTGSLNLGLDFGFLKDRIMGTVEYYRSVTRDLLMKASINETTGYSSQLQNMGNVLNEGVELTLNFVPVKTKNVVWTIGTMLSHNKNKILKLNGDQDDLANNWFIGHNIDAYYDYEFVGIYQTGDGDLNPNGTSYPQAGDIRVKDQDGNGVIDENDRIVIDRDPKLMGSLNTTLTCYGVDLNLDFYGVYGSIKQNKYLYEYNSGGALSGKLNGMKVDYWTVDNPSNTAPRPRDGTILYHSSLSYQDASYFRLRNLTVGYTFPKKWMEKAHISKLRLYFTASNVFTVTKFLSYSPENSAGSYPEPRTFIGGINLSFN